VRLTILTHYYPPEPGAPQVRLQALARGLDAAGVEVTVHTAPPHYPDGRVAPGYRNRGLSRESEEGVEIVRSPVFAAANRGVARRLVDHASFAASAVASCRRAGGADVVVAETPPLFLAAAAPAYARRARARLVLHVSDLWPDSVVELGTVTNRRAIGMARALERHAYRHAARIVTPTAGIAERLEQRSEAQGKVFRVPPAVDIERFTAPPVRRDGPLRVLYAGTVGLAQGVTSLVEAARRVGPSVMRLTIAGAGAELEDVRREAAGRGHIRVLGAVDADAVPRLYAETDVAAVLLRDRPIFRAALPTKTFEAMASGRPVLLAGRGEIAELVQSAAAGVVVAPGDVDALAGAIATLASQPERRLQEIGASGIACAKRFDRAAMLDRWLALLNGLA
jgi:glycosyltransferase involved in cell wall biosynthesis